MIINFVTISELLTRLVRKSAFIENSKIYRTFSVFHWTIKTKLVKYFRRSFQKISFVIFKVRHMIFNFVAIKELLVQLVRKAASIENNNDLSNFKCPLVVDENETIKVFQMIFSKTLVFYLKYDP